MKNDEIKIGIDPMFCDDTSTHGPTLTQSAAALRERAQYGYRLTDGQTILFSQQTPNKNWTCI